MKGIVAWFAGNSVAANLLMLMLLVGGVIASVTMKVELLPEFSLDLVSVAVPYPGAAPEEVEEGICVRIEEKVHALDGVKRVTSTASEGLGTVLIECQSGADVREVLDDVKSAVDTIDTFPEEAERPIVQDLDLRRQVIDVVVYGDVEERVLKRVAERIRDDLSELPGISQVELAAARPYEISIEVSEVDLRRYGLSFDEVAAAVRRASLDLSGGSVETEGGEVLLRTKAQAYRGDEFEALLLRAEDDGTRVHLGDVATVVDGFADTDQAARFDGVPALFVKVFRTGDENALGIAEATRDYVARVGRELPEGMRIATFDDTSIPLKGRLDMMIENGLQGLLLLFVVLALFLRFRLAFWIALGIPVSFLGAAALMPAMDASINMLSLFGFILVLGIVVDDAIVVGESIHSEHERGAPGLEGAVRGAHRVNVPVVFAVLTSVAAFVPLMILPGMMGKFFKVIPLVVVPCLVLSLVESKLILPAHLAHSSRGLDRLSTVAPFRWWIAFQSVFANGLDWFVKSVYRPALRFALRWRYLTIASAMASLLVTIGLLAGGHVKFVFFNPVEAETILASVEMPLGTSAAVTAKAVDGIEASAFALREELAGAGHGAVVKHVVAAVGDQPQMKLKGDRSGSTDSTYSGGHLGEVVVELMPAEERPITATEVLNRWRELTGPVPGATAVKFSSELMSTGAPIHVRLKGADIEELGLIASEVRERLAGFEGVTDIADTFRAGKLEVDVDLLPAGETLGLTNADLARQLRQGFHGEEAQRIQRGRDDIRVMVRYPEDARNSLTTVEGMRLRTPEGDEIPFSLAAMASVGRGWSTINRTDRRRTVDVTAELDLSTGANANEINAVLAETTLPEILSEYPGVDYSFEGQQTEQRETVSALVRYYLIAVFVIFALMAIPLSSWLQPAIVMTAIPFGLIGAVLGHLVIGIEVSVLSLCGIVALTGVVVNDSLVMVHRVNEIRGTGVSIAEAAEQGGMQRFRAILLTSLTTFASLTPLMLERSMQAQFLIPMAVSLAFGVLFATLITLFFVPSSYLILEDLRRAGRWLVT